VEATAAAETGEKGRKVHWEFFTCSSENVQNLHHAKRKAGSAGGEDWNAFDSVERIGVQRERGPLSCCGSRVKLLSNPAGAEEKGKKKTSGHCEAILGAKKRAGEKVCNPS